MISTATSSNRSGCSRACSSRNKDITNLAYAGEAANHQCKPAARRSGWGLLRFTAANSG
eukprot:CAMPEP_0203901806 /NCGR_PEP_ID=MMETSP0359-20131031/43912_1 /ASSEMBLY_ACC=CAM_ASM_000338 /TAXON_ID=268821 /ORGANISM="Scrippsiella Hangoei, Strain SHTV-5" /LENGTH=58 /DNA_ID=CAMNT_0050825519 /DNA_START=102 /DNA_END=274 /DNA_ORIENTATION=+